MCSATSRWSHYTPAPTMCSGPLHPVEDFADGRVRYDRIIDVFGRNSVSRLRRALTSRGRLVIVGGEGDQ